MNDFDHKTLDAKIGILRPIRIATWDIESTALDATRGYILCVSAKEVLPNSLNGKTHTVRIDDVRNPNPFSDKWLVKEVVKLLDSFDLLLGWNSSQFDFPMVNSRCIKHGLQPPAKNYRRDLLYCAKAHCRIGGNRLAAWGKFLFGNTAKTSLDWEIWLSAMRGEKKALNYIVQHNIMDVLETERVYKKLMPLLGKLRRA